MNTLYTVFTVIIPLAIGVVIAGIVVMCALAPIFI